MKLLCWHFCWRKKDNFNPGHDILIQGITVYCYHNLLPGNDNFLHSCIVEGLKRELQFFSRKCASNIIAGPLTWSRYWKSSFTFFEMCLHFKVYILKIHICHFSVKKYDIPRPSTLVKFNNISFPVKHMCRQYAMSCFT